MFACNWEKLYFSISQKSSLQQRGKHWQLSCRVRKNKHSLFWNNVKSPRIKQYDWENLVPNKWSGCINTCSPDALITFSISVFLKVLPLFAKFCFGDLLLMRCCMVWSRSARKGNLGVSLSQYCQELSQYCQELSPYCHKLSPYCQELSPYCREWLPYCHKCHTIVTKY